MKCGVCEAHDHKYKCPDCRIPYCSLVCWKEHKKTPCKPPTNQEEDVQPVVMNDALKRREYLYPTEDTVPIDKLKLLDDSKGLQHVLENPHVRDILRMVDSSPNPRAAIHAAMLEPIFVEFADECFKIVSPQDKEPPPV